MIMAGDFTLEFSTFLTMFPKFPVISRCFAVVAFSMTATLVSVLSPDFIKMEIIRGSVSIPIRITIVSAARAILPQSTVGSPFAGSSCPVTMATDEAKSLCVNGIPEYAEAPIADVIPGTISNFMSCLNRYSASSAPLPNHKRVPAF